MVSDIYVYVNAYYATWDSWNNKCQKVVPWKGLKRPVEQPGVTVTMKGLSVFECKAELRHKNGYKVKCSKVLSNLSKDIKVKHNWLVLFKLYFCW